MNAEQLKQILEDHSLWLAGDDSGKRADMEGADLLGANLRGADLRVGGQVGRYACWNKEDDYGLVWEVQS